MGQLGVRRWLHGACARGLEDWIILLLAGGSATAALLFRACWLLLLGFFLGLAFVLWIIFQSNFSYTLSRGIKTSQLDRYKGVQNPELMSLMTAFCRGYGHIHEIVRDAPAELRSSLAPVLVSLDELEAAAAWLSLRAQKLEDCLRTVRRSIFEEELHRLAALAYHTLDAETRADYESVLAMQTERLQALITLSKARERTLGSLLRIVVLVKGLTVRIVELYILNMQRTKGRESAPAAAPFLKTDLLGHRSSWA